MRCCIHFSLRPCVCQNSLAQSTEREGSAISCIRSYPTLASHNLIGSAFGLGTDWIKRRSVSASATSVRYFFSSEASNFSR